MNTDRNCDNQTDVGLLIHYIEYLEHINGIDDKYSVQVWSDYWGDDEKNAVDDILGNTIAPNNGLSDER